MFLESFGKTKIVLPNGSAKNIPEKVLLDLIEEDFPLTPKQKSILGDRLAIFYVPIHNFQDFDGATHYALNDGVRRLELNRFIPTFIDQYCGGENIPLLFLERVDFDYDGMYGHPDSRGKMLIKNRAYSPFSDKSNIPRDFLSNVDGTTLRGRLNVIGQY